MNGLDFCQNPKTLIFRLFRGLFRSSWPTEIFFQKSSFETHAKKSEKQ